MPADPWVISLDLGTGSCKAIAVDRHGRLLAKSSVDYPMRVDARTLAATQSLEDLCRALVRAVGQLMAQCFSDAPPTAMALSGAMHSLMICRRNGQLLADAMTWADGRSHVTAGQCKKRIDSAELHRRTGCPLEYVYHPARLAYLKSTLGISSGDGLVWAGLSEAIYHRLTGQWVIGRSMASTTGLLNLYTSDWDAMASDLVLIDRAQWPPWVDDETYHASLCPQAAERLGLPSGLPVYLPGADGLLAHFAGGRLEPGDLTVTVGTTGAIRLASASPMVDEYQQTWCYRLDGRRWIRGGAINNGGLALSRVIEQYYAHLPYPKAISQAMRDADAVSAGCDGLMILPYFTGERTPYWNPTPHQCHLGRQPDQTPGHHVRAVMQSVAFCLAQVKQSLGLDAPTVRQATLTGGIVQSPLWCRILADVLQWELTAIEQADASALGAAMKVLIASGLNDENTLLAQARIASVRRYRPDPGQASTYRSLMARFQSESQAIMQP